MLVEIYNIFKSLLVLLQGDDLEVIMEIVGSDVTCSQFFKKIEWKQILKKLFSSIFLKILKIQ